MQSAAASSRCGAMLHLLLARRAASSRTSAAAVAAAPTSSRTASLLPPSFAPAFPPAAPAIASGGRPFSTDRHSTTIVCIRRNGRVCMMGDGQVSMGAMIVKPNARKIRRILPKSPPGAPTLPTGKKEGGGDGEKEKVDDEEEEDDGATLVGFAGSTADAFTLLERLESKLDEYPGQLTRSCVELAKGWRTDKYLRRLEASLLVADKEISLELTGNGDVLESHDGVLAVGSGSPYAIAAARALIKIPDLDAEEVARRSMTIASEMCVYTNKNFLVESIKSTDDPSSGSDDGDGGKID